MEQVCPRCQSSSYQMPGMKLMVNTCGHMLCESCLDVVFARPSAPCPECGVVLRRNLFRLKQFDDTRVEIEVDIRKKIIRDYNKSETDFCTLRQFNDYLEEVETIVYNLSHNVDVEETRARLEAYKKENQSSILRNRMRQQRQEQVLTTRLVQEQTEVEMRNEEALAKDAEATKRKKKQKESILEDLMYSDLPASEVLANHMAASDMANGEESLSGPHPSSAYATLPSHLGSKDIAVYEPVPVLEGNVYSYVPPSIESHGPQVPPLEDLKDLGYLDSFGELEDVHLGGGFLPAYACRRSLLEAFSCLLFFPGQSTATEGLEL